MISNDVTVEQIVAGAKAFGLLKTFCSGEGTIALVNETDTPLSITITNYRADEIVLVTRLRPHSYFDFSPPRGAGSRIIRSKKTQTKGDRNPSLALFVFETKVCEGSEIHSK
jgi:hypothetical protein